MGMGIIDRAKAAKAAKDKATAERDRAIRAANDYRRENENRRAREFLKELELPRKLKGTINDGTVAIWYKKQVVVEISFGHETRSEYQNAEYQGESEPFETSYAKYMADWKPEDAEEYKRQKKGQRDNFYPTSDEDMNELGEFLIRVMNDEFTFD